MRDLKRTDLYGEEQLPLLYRAAREGAWGRRWTWENSAISDALFVYLEGEPERQSVEALTRQFTARPLMCLSSAWEEYIRAHHPEAACYQRALMEHRRSFELGGEPLLPEEFRLVDFDEELFSRHPFSHGENYPAFAAFRESGAGAAVLHEGRVIASASSFLSHRGEVELDVSTEAEFRRRGLAAACVRRMLADCQRRGIMVHWDAQNEASRRLAEKFGFRLQNTYCTYVLSARRAEEQEKQHD